MRAHAGCRSIALLPLAHPTQAGRAGAFGGSVAGLHVDGAELHGVKVAASVGEAVFGAESMLDQLCVRWAANK